MLSNHVRIPAKVLAIVCSTLLVVIPASAQSDGFGQVPSTGWETSKLSQAVLSDANQAVEGLLAAQQSGHLTANVVSNAATALQMMFDHFQEIGLNTAIQKQILSNQQGFLNFHPSDAQVSEYQSELGSRGINVSLSRVKSVMDPSFEGRQRFLAEVQKVGLHQAELEVVSQLREQAQELASSASVSDRLTRSTNKAHLVRVISAPCEACFILAGIGLASGCSVTGAACGAALGACLICSLGG